MAVGVAVQTNVGVIVGGIGVGDAVAVRVGGNKVGVGDAVGVAVQTNVGVKVGGIGVGVGGTVVGDAGTGVGVGEGVIVGVMVGVDELLLLDISELIYSSIQV